MPDHAPDRRPLATRQARWARALAAAMARKRVSPNGVSLASIAVAALGAWALAAVPCNDGAFERRALYVVAAAMIQLRLLCNLLDGLIAVEGGLRTKTGDVFNELPDRIADVLTIAAAGYAARHVPHAIELGWLASTLALIAAYVRVLGKSVGAGMHFLGPMAKQHRMALLTATCLIAATQSDAERQAQVMVAGLGLLALGTLVTIARRVHRILATLNAP